MAVETPQPSFNKPIEAVKSFVSNIDTNTLIPPPLQKVLTNVPAYTQLTKLFSSVMTEEDASVIVESVQTGDMDKAIAVMEELLERLRDDSASSDAILDIEGGLDD